MISIDSTPATAPAGVDHGAVLGLVQEQVRQGVAEHVVQLHHRLGPRAQLVLHCSPASARSASQPSGLPRSSTSSG